MPVVLRTVDGTLVGCIKTVTVVPSDYPMPPGVDPVTADEIHVSGVIDPDHAADVARMVAQRYVVSPAFGGHVLDAAPPDLSAAEGYTIYDQWQLTGAVLSPALTSAWPGESLPMRLG